MADQLFVERVPGSDPAVGHWLWAIQDARSRTVRALDGLSPDALDWSDACSPHTIGTLLYHIAAIEADWLFADVLGKGFPPKLEAVFPYEVRDEQGKLTLVKGQKPESYWERLKIVREYLLDTFQKMSLEDFRRSRIQAKYEVTPEWVVHHLCQHEAEHRSEMAALRSRYEAK
jgi:uncharacterized damage-inducible protein DinB